MPGYFDLELARFTIGFADKSVDQHPRSAAV